MADPARKLPKCLTDPLNDLPGRAIHVSVQLIKEAAEQIDGRPWRAKVDMDTGLIMLVRNLDRGDA
jgi:hypothetical protein